jgi:osmotically-inducible protein OsmY
MAGMKPAQAKTTLHPSPVLQAVVDKTDVELKTDVLAELAYEPTVKVSDIGVLVDKGIVTLNGYATSYSEKWHALRAAKRVRGMRAIVDAMVINLAESHKRTDADIAASAITQINWFTTVPQGTIQVSVRDGWITIDGVVDWWYQKDAAEDVVQYMIGVKGVKNQLTIKPRVAPDDVQASIKAAFARNAELDATKIHIETDGNIVTLTGKARNHVERDEAERVAWAAPGVIEVDNQIKLEWHWGFGA